MENRYVLQINKINKIRQIQIKIDIRQAEKIVTACRPWVSMWIWIEFLKIIGKVLYPFKKISKWFDNHRISVYHQYKGYEDRVGSGNRIPFLKISGIIW